MHRSALMPRLAPLLLLAALAATGTAHAETARCHVVYGGEERYPKGEGIEAISVVELAAELAALAA